MEVHLYLKSPTTKKRIINFNFNTLHIMYNVYKYLNSKPNPIKVNLEQSLFFNLHDIADICIPHNLT